MITIKRNYSVNLLCDNVYTFRKLINETEGGNSQSVYQTTK